MANPRAIPNVVHYRLDKSFGPAGAATGGFLLLVGIISVLESFSGLILISLGSFMAFSTSGSSVDFDGFRVRFSDNLFGVVRVGSWKYVSRRMSVGLLDTRIVYRVYSMSNRSVEVSNNDFRIFLYNEDGQKDQAICKFTNRGKALDELAKISDLLGLAIREDKPGAGKGNMEIS